MSTSTMGRSDALLWICIGFLGVSAFHRAWHNLLAVRAATVVTSEEKGPEIIGQHTEDAISVSTLGDLLKHPNYDIRQASKKILVERITRNENYLILLRNIKSRKHKVRDQALATLRYLSTTSVHEITRTYETFEALVDVLQRFLPNVRRRTHVPDTDWKSRTRAEKDAMFVLDQSINHHVNDALMAGLVDRWLAHYPFGGYNPPSTSSPAWAEVEKHEIVNRLRLGSTNDLSLGGILRSVYAHPLGRRKLREHKLVGSAIEEMSLTEDNVAAARHRAHMQRRERSDSEWEMSSVRRRNRQAMVISDGAEPITRENIYQGPAVGDT